MTDGCWYTQGKYHSTYYHGMPEEYERLVDDKGRGIEVWTGDSRSPRYQQVYCHPKHFAEARNEVAERNAKMSRQSDSYYAQPWV